MPDSSTYQSIELEPHHDDAGLHQPCTSSQTNTNLSSIHLDNEEVVTTRTTAIDGISSPRLHHPRWWKYAVLFATFLDFLLVFGFFKGMGVFILEWQEDFEISTVKASTITIGTGFVLPFTTPIGGALCQKYGCRIITIIGAFIASSCVLVATFSPNVPVLIFLLCFCGLGLSMTFAPCPSILGFYFGRHLGFANGIMLSGVGAGILIIPPILQALCNMYGWRGALLVSSAILANTAVCGSTFRPTHKERHNIIKLWAKKAPSEKPGQKRNVIQNPDYTEHDYVHVDVPKAKTSSLEANTRVHVVSKFMQIFHFFHIHLLWANRCLSTFYILVLFMSFGYFSSLVYLIPRVVADLHVAKQEASYVLSTVGISSMFGRAAHGPLLDRGIISGFHLAPIALAISGLSSLLVPFAHNYALQHLLALTFGMGSGVFNALAIMLIRTLVDSSVLASGFGFYVMITAFGNLFGVFSLGALYDATGNYNTSFYVAGGATFMAFFFSLILAIFRRKDSNKASTPANKYQDVVSEDKELENSSFRV